MADVRFSIWLREGMHLPPRRIMEAREFFGSVEQACVALQRGEGRAFFTQAELAKGEAEPLALAEGILERCRKCGVQAVPFEDEGYPAPLRTLYDPPALLYVRGRLPDFTAQPAISIVGQRKATARGVETARHFAHVLSAHGFVVVSGMAYGVDGAAHRGALEGPTPTVAVFGTAIDVCYPSSHNGLLRQILEEGAALSEYPPGVRGVPVWFRQRDRLISGLTLGTLVVEAPRKSGSLITASFALEQGRDVFAVPGCVDLPEYEGSNALLRDGAVFCTDPVEICREYAARLPNMVAALGEDEAPAPPARRDAPPQASTPPPGLTPAEQAVYQAIRGRTHIDALCRQVELPASQVLVSLTLLQVKGLVKECGAKYFEIL